MPLSPRELLEQSFARAEEAFLRSARPQASPKIEAACDAVFGSKTQAYREVLLGCLLTHITEPTRDIRQPYVDQGPNAYSGRTLDEKVINPYLHSKSVPCSKGPFLSVFRRQVRFDTTTKAGVKDKAGYDAFLELLAVIEAEHDAERLLGILDYICSRFVLLREEARIELLKLERISLNGYKQVIARLVATPSGGRLTMILVRAMVETIIRSFSLPWELDVQEINVADRASGAGGDIAIKDHGEVLLTMEVTERAVDASRVQATFRDKITPGHLRDYVFMVHLGQIGDEARQLAEKYFTHGYDINLVDIQEWLVSSLVTVGARGRCLFQERVVEHLSAVQVPKVLKLAWNEAVESLTGG